MKDDQADEGGEAEQQQGKWQPLIADGLEGEGGPLFSLSQLDSLFRSLMTILLAVHFEYFNCKQLLSIF